MDCRRFVPGLVLTISFAAWSTASAQWCEEIKLVPPPHDGRKFGISVEAGVGTLLVGNPGYPDTGGVVVYAWDGSRWVAEQVITKGDLGPPAEFGTSIALSGDTLLVSAPKVESATTGTVYAFVHDGEQWNLTAQLVPDTGGSHVLFGRALAIDGDTAIVLGLIDFPYYDIPAIYVFHRDGTSWRQETVIEAPDQGLSGTFGFSLAVSGNRFAVGDPHAVPAGLVHIYRHGARGWEVESQVGASDADPLAEFGRGVDLERDVLLAGARSHDPLPTAYFFRWDGATWQEESRVDSGTAHTGAFGDAVSLDGDTALIGSVQRAYFYRYDGSSWMKWTEMTPSDHQDEDYFGCSASLRGDLAVIGARDDSHSNATGSAYVAYLPSGASSWANYGAGWPGSNGIPSLSLAGDPILGSTTSLQISNSSALPTPALLVLGTTAIAEDTPLGGTLLVQPLSLVIIILPGAGLSTPIAIPCNRAFSGLEVDAQALEEDAGASHGVSFTPGLRVVLGG